MFSKKPHSGDVDNASDPARENAELMPRGFALPAAVSRLAQKYDLGPVGAETAFNEDYTDRPSRESLAMLGEELGLRIQIDHKNIAKIPATDFPLIALDLSGAAYILEKKSDKQITVEGDTETKLMTLPLLASVLSGTVLLLGLGDAAVRDNTQHTAVKVRKESSFFSTNRLIRWMLDTIWQDHCPLALQLLLAAVLSNLFLFALPLYIMSVYDRVIPHSAFESLQTLTIGIAIILLTDVGLRFARLKFTDAISMTLARRLQLHLYRTLLYTKLDQKPKSAASLSVIHTEVEALSAIVPEVMVASLADTAFAITVLVLIANIGGPVVLAPAIGMAIIATIIVSVASAARNSMTDSVALRSAASSQIAETHESLTAVKAASAEQSLLSRFERIGSLAATKGHASRHKVRFATNLAGVVVQATIAVTIILGVIRIDAGLMSIGSMAAITILVGRAMMPVGQLADQLSRLRSLRDVVTKTLDAITHTEEDAGDTENAQQRAVTGSFRLKNISYIPPDSDTPTLSDIGLNITAGERIGLIGKNGSGKSTLMHLLPMLYAPHTGTIQIDGFDSRQYNPRRLRRDIGFMPQETVLFQRSLRDNICLGAENIDDETFIRAVTLSGVVQFAQNHPQGFSMNVGPRGEYLSAGERQAVGLARVLLRQRAVLILDEPTSLMDHTAEAHVIASLRSLPSSTTLIVSTHRLSLLDLVNRLITLDGGKIVADGPKFEVLPALAKKAA